MTTVFHPRHRCTQQQRDFINHYEIDKGLEVIFEDVILNERFDHYTPSYDKDHINARVQLDTGRKRYQDIRGMYTTLYDEQLRNILSGYDIFECDIPIPFEEIVSQPAVQEENRLPIAQRLHVKKSARLRACSRETQLPRNIPIGSAHRQF